MKYNRNIHPAAMVLKSLLGIAEFTFKKFNYSSNELIVVNYHSTPDKFLANFESQVVFFKKHFHVISPNDLSAYYSGTLSSKKSCLLFTFDDGLKNNLGAAKVLKKHSVKAYFFIVPAFIDTPTSQQKDFYIKNIRPYINPFIDSDQKDFEAMSWDEIKELSKSGHQLGSHTYTHTLMQEKASEQISLIEIVESKRYIEQKLETRLEAFCSINNTLLSVGAKEKQMIKDNYSFHFTTLPGLNAENKNPLFIKRRNIEAFWLKGAVCFSLGKFDLTRWKLKISEYENL